MEEPDLEILQLHQVWRRRALRISEGGATEGYDYYLRLCDVERARWPEPFYNSKRTILAADLTLQDIKNMWRVLGSQQATSTSDILVPMAFLQI
ncbi:unnamed protein product [Fusarium graminearum]|nr:unnamed protein product [Fusarium graminearum]